MANILRHAVIGCGLAGALGVAAVTPSFAQGVYANPYYYSAQQGYAGYNGYAFPRLRGPFLGLSGRV